MKTLLAISPHLDDAIFSAGALLWTAARRGWRVVVATVFTGNVERPSGFALACQLDKGLPAEIDYMALRREEDRQACAAIGAVARHLLLLEAPHRGYANAAALFGQVLPNDIVDAAVRAALAGLLLETSPAIVLAPIAIGGHVDHVIVRRCIDAIAPDRLLLWEDWPYVDRTGPSHRAYARRWPISVAARAAKQIGCTRYRSQIDFQFGGAAALTARLERQNEEFYFRAENFRGQQ